MFTQQQVQEVMDKYYTANDAKGQAEVLKNNKELLKAANLRDRKLGRVGLPFSTKLDDRTDEIPFLAGLKKAVVYIGSGVGTVLGVTKLVRWIF